MYYNGTTKIRIYYCEWDRSGGVTSHELLRHALEKYQDRDMDSFTVCRDGEYGKPYVKEFPDVHFSVSHCGGFWTCAVGPCEMGLDLQEMRDRKTDQIARRFFHPSEIAWLSSHGKEEFFRIWAMKESYVKYTGKGLTEGLDHFSVIDGVPACQQEIFFRDGFWMILTTKEEADVCLDVLPDMGTYREEPVDGQGEDA